MKRLFLLLAMSFLVAGNAGAAVIAGWDMAGADGALTSYGGYSDVTEVTAADMVMGDGLSAYDAYNAFNTTGWADSDDGDYIEIGFTVADGYAATLDELWIGTRSSNTGPGTIGVYTSLDDYTDPIFTITQDGTAYSNSIIDISDLVITGEFYVRLYEIDDTQADGEGDTYDGGTFRISDYYDSGEYTDVQFTGTISTVPVPGAVWLLGSGLLAAFGARRKNRM